MTIYHLRHTIAKITLAQFLLVLFLSIHFTIWGGCYTEDGLSVESIVDQEMQLVEEGTDRLTLSTVSSVSPSFDVWICFSVAMGLFCPFFIAYFLEHTKVSPEIIPATLVRLSVRMDH